MATIESTNVFYTQYLGGFTRDFRKSMAHSTYLSDQYIDPREFKMATTKTLRKINKRTHPNKTV